MGVQLVWFKRDLRVRDHRPLAEAALRGPTLCLFVHEPEVQGAEDFDPSHAVFLRECLDELARELESRGGRLIERTGRLPETLDELHAERPFEAMWSHEETGNALTYARDRRVKAWARRRGVAWREIPQNGVVRGLEERDGWSKRWNRRMSEPVVDAPPAIPEASGVAAGRRPPLAELGLGESERIEVQAGGESRAQRTLESFLTVRGVSYRKDMSTPLEGWEACSRLSPYLAWGCLSVRQVHQAAKERQREVRELRAAEAGIDPRWSQSLASFQSRLRWHCHFTQKLEDEPRIEHENFNRAYDGLREDDFDEGRFAAWREGRTGYPMVDACMRALRATGWMNFRMRAMLVSFAAHHLWLHWRPVGLELARLFLDYEPGIHWSQAQMQSGTTGINTVRIYSPAKQVRDQDPRGVFVRRWVPELEGVPDEHLAEPQLMPPLLQRSSGCVIGEDYPEPIVDHAEAVRRARERIFAVRRTEEAKAEAERVRERHGSRKRAPRRRRRA